jgi:flagellar biosynthesis protein FliP
MKQSGPSIPFLIRLVLAALTFIVATIVLGPLYMQYPWCITLIVLIAGTLGACLIPDAWRKE